MNYQNSIKKTFMTMNGNKDMSPGRLYLSRGDGQDIYIDKYQLSQDQINGIRFLYRQLKKEKPGVILNDPVGSRTALQVVLFLNAIQRTLDKPILILCNYGEENWMKYFRTWTNLNDDVVVKPSNPFVKNMSVCINSMENLASFSSRDWSVMVVESDFTTRDILQTNFKSDFKIWITSVNLKDDLQTLSLIHNWLNPKEKFNMKDFKPSTNNPKDVITKAIQLDAFIEDIVYKSKPQKPSETVATIRPEKVTRKNKDATGTKIKRSKRNTDLDDANKVSQNDSIKVADQITKAITTDDVKLNVTNDEQEKMDVETFIRDQEPIGPEAYREYLTDSDSTSPSSQHSRTKSLDNAKNNVKDNMSTEADSTVPNSKDKHIVQDQTAPESQNHLNIKANGHRNENITSNPIEIDDDNLSTDLVLHYDDIENKTSSNMKADGDKTHGENDADTRREPNVNGIDFKMKELEDMTMKKFTGTFLDSLF